MAPSPLKQLHQSGVDIDYIGMFGQAQSRQGLPSIPPQIQLPRITTVACSGRSGDLFAARMSWCQIGERRVQSAGCSQK